MVSIMPTIAGPQTMTMMATIPKMPSGKPVTRLGEDRPVCVMEDANFPTIHPDREPARFSRT
jgi:hypothetical protein